MESLASWKGKYFLAYCSAKLNDTLLVTLEILTVEHQQHTGSGSGLVRTSKPSLNPAVVKADVVRSPLFITPAKKRDEKITRFGGVGHWYLDIVDTIFYFHFR